MNIKSRNYRGHFVGRQRWVRHLPWRLESRWHNCSIAMFMHLPQRV